MLKDTVSSDASVNFIEKKMKENNIEKTLLYASYFPNKGTGISNYRLYNWIKDKPNFNMIGSLDFSYYGLQGYNELKELKGIIKGIKIYTGYQRVYTNSNLMKKILDCCSGISEVNHNFISFVRSILKEVLQL